MNGQLRACKEHEIWMFDRLSECPIVDQDRIRLELERSAKEMPWVISYD